MSKDFSSRALARPEAEERPPPSSVRMSEANKPFHLNEDVWLYEEPRGILIVHDVKVNGEHIRTEKHYIPWAKVRAAIIRRDYALAKRKSP